MRKRGGVRGEAYGEGGWIVTREDDDDDDDVLLERDGEASMNW